MKLQMLCLALACYATTMILATSAHGADELMREGTVVSASGGSLVFTDMAGKQVTFKVAETVPVTINGHMAKLSALKAGMRIRVTVTQDDTVKAVNTIDDHKFAAQTGCSRCA
jgi:hypothetical protein